LLTASQLAEILGQKDFFFVNTHIPYEGEIDLTDALIPFDQIEQEIAQFPADKGAKIVVYCRSGRMSAIAADTLARLGYTNVWDLGGGVIAWEEAGFILAGK
jgi:rhodanese-related sulfurtransferase